MEKYILYLQDWAGAGVMVVGRVGDGIGPGQPVALAAETGPWCRARVTALQAGWLTWVVPVARVSAGTVTQAGCPTLAVPAAATGW